MHYSNLQQHGCSHLADNSNVSSSPPPTFLSQSSGAWISAASFNRANIYACTFINQYTWQSRVRDTSSVQRCLCVHVLESRPSLVALCLRGGSVYTMGSKAYGRVYVRGMRTRDLVFLWVCVCMRKRTKKRERERESEQVSHEMPGFSRGVFTVHTHYSNRSRRNTRTPHSSLFLNSFLPRTRNVSISL